MIDDVTLQVEIDFYLFSLTAGKDITSASS